MNETPAETTENRRRFAAARHALGWSLRRAAAEIETSIKLLEGWLYVRGRDVPRLAVLLIEARAQIAAMGVPALPVVAARYGRRQDILRGLGEGRTYQEIASDLGISKARVYQIARDFGATRRVQQAAVRSAMQAEVAQGVTERAGDIAQAVAKGVALVESGMGRARAAAFSGAPEAALVKVCAHLPVGARKSAAEYVVLHALAVEAVREQGSYRDGIVASGLSLPTVRRACRAAGVKPKTRKPANG